LTVLVLIIATTGSSQLEPACLRITVTSYYKKLARTRISQRTHEPANREPRFAVS
jgi:hypothetical protein